MTNIVHSLRGLTAVVILGVTALVTGCSPDTVTRTTSTERSTTVTPPPVTSSTTTTTTQQQR